MGGNLGVPKWLSPNEMIQNSKFKTNSTENQAKKKGQKPGCHKNSIRTWEDLEDAFWANFQGTYVRPPDADDLSYTIQQPGKSARKLWNRFLTKKNQIIDCPDTEPLEAFKHSVRDEWLA